jgi:hypothetical protein
MADIPDQTDPRLYRVTSAMDKACPDRGWTWAEEAARGFLIMLDALRCDCGYFTTRGGIFDDEHSPTCPLSDPDYKYKSF